MTILAIDPGAVTSAALVWDAEGNRIVSMWEKLSVADLLKLVSKYAADAEGAGVLAIERVGMAAKAGLETFDTCVSIGRAVECWNWSGGRPEAMLVFRKTIVTHLCGGANAGDKDVRYALVERYGERDSKKQKGALKDVTGHLWAAFALAVYVGDTMTQGTGEKGEL